MSLVLAASAMTMPTALSADSCNPCNPCDAGFDGLYIGVNAGVATIESHRHDLDGAIFGQPWGISTIETGFTGGLQAGWDTQYDNLVVGLVGDFNWASLDRETHYYLDEYNVKSKLEWTSSIRLRVGVPVCDTLVYLTGGAAVAKLKHEWRVGDDTLFSHSKTRWGWIGGVGLEHRIGCNLSLGAEFLYSYFDTNRRTWINGSSDYDFALGGHEYQGRLTLNYHFGSDFFSGLGCCL